MPEANFIYQKNGKGGTMKDFTGRTPVVIFVVALFSLFLLGGCVSTKQKFQDDMMSKGVKPLTAAEIANLHSSATAYGKNPKYEWEGYYSADGKIQSKVWWPGGEESDKGEWRVTDDDLFCTKYLGKWSKYGESCYSVYPTSGEFNYTSIKKTGSPSKGYPDGVLPFKITPGM